MAKIVTLKDNVTNETLYPQAIADGVFDDDGDSIGYVKDTKQRVAVSSLNGYGILIGYIHTDNAYVNLTNCHTLVCPVVPGKKYCVTDGSSTNSGHYYIFTNDSFGQSAIDDRAQLSLGDNILTAPAGSEFLFACVDLSGNGNIDGSSIYEYTELLETLGGVDGVSAIKADLGDISKKIIAKNVYQYSVVGTVHNYINTSGNYDSQFAGYCTGLIPVQPNTYYYLSGRKCTNTNIRGLKIDGSTRQKVLAASTGTEYNNFNLPDPTCTTAVVNGPFLTTSETYYIQINITELYSEEVGDYYKIMLEEIGSTYDPDFVPSPYDGGIDYYQIKNDAIVMDSQVTQGSELPVESGAVFNAIHEAASTSLKVLLVGSSHGVNTICMFPVLAYHAGINIVCGNLYTGSASIGLFEERPNVQIPYMADQDEEFGRFTVFKDGEWTVDSNGSTVDYALGLYNWDVIILQRGASEDETWTAEQAGFFQHLLDHIRTECNYNPKIYFNTGIADAVKPSQRSSQIEKTNLMVSSAEEMRQEFGIEVIPTAVAVQYARATYLSTTGNWGTTGDMTADGQHLDDGVGQYVTGCTVFEKILGDYFNISILQNSYIPVWNDIAAADLWADSTNFTTITPYFSKMAKYCASLAVKDKQYISSTASLLNSKFGNAEVSYTITNTLTGCTNTNTAATINSDDAYLAKLNVNTGLNMQSVTVTMGGIDVTESVYVAEYTRSGVTYQYHAIRIGVVTGNIVITAIAN